MRSTSKAPLILIAPQHHSDIIAGVVLPMPRWLYVPRASELTKEHRGLVAVVEDDVSLNLAILRQLRAAGFRACSFRSGQEVLAAHGHIADCFVLDVHLPDMTGFELMHQLGTTTPIVVITAHDDPMHRRASQEVHATAYLTKPFASKALLDAVTRAIAPAQLS
jgi:FixJ family two-component response regulator